MGTTGKRRGKTHGKRRIGQGLALVVGAAAIGLPLFMAPTASAAPPPPPAPLVGETLTDSIDLGSLPATETLTLPKIDPTLLDLFALTKVTITATLESSLEGHVENLSTTQSKSLDVGANVDMTMVSDVLSSDLEASHALLDGVNLAPGATSPLMSSDSDNFSEEIVLPGPLASLFGLLVGESGNIEFDVQGLVDTFVVGPAPYLSTGAAIGKATVTIDYEYVEVCPHDEELPKDSDDCVPPPPPECVDVTKIDGFGENPIGVHTSEDGNVELTVTGVNADKSIDWTSNVPIFWMSVKGGSDDVPGGGDDPGDSSHVLFEFPGGATSSAVPPGTPVHAPLNENSGPEGDYYAVSHIHVCYEPDDEVCEETQRTLVDSDECVEDQCPDMDGIQDSAEDCQPPPPPECVDVTKIDGFGENPIGLHTSEDGNVDLTITGVNADKSIDWTSNVAILWMNVKGGSDDVPGGGDDPTDSSHQLFEFAGGAMSSAVAPGTPVHAPLNESSGPEGDYFDVSHIHLCYDPDEEVCEWNDEVAPDSDLCEPPCEFNEQLLRSHEDCVPPCEFNEQLLSTHEDCVPPCEFNEQLLSTDDNCTPPPPPPPVCATFTKIDDLPDTLAVGETYTSENDDVELTIDALNGDKSFDWSSNVTIFSLNVKGGGSPGGGDDPGDASHFLNSYPGGATTGDSAHAPLNESTLTEGDYFAASHIHVCYEPEDEGDQEPRPRQRSSGGGQNSQLTTEKDGQDGSQEGKSQEQPSSDPSPAPEPKSDPAPKPEPKEEPEPKPEPKPEPEPKEPEPKPEPEPEAKEPEVAAKVEKAKTEEDDDTDGDDAGSGGEGAE